MARGQRRRQPVQLGVLDDGGGGAVPRPDQRDRLRPAVSGAGRFVTDTGRASTGTVVTTTGSAVTDSGVTTTRSAVTDSGVTDTGGVVTDTGSVSR
jgi:hypothetical protein